MTYPADFPHFDQRSVFVQAVFLKVNFDKLTDVDAVRARLRRHEVTAADVLQACLRRECDSAVLIKYAVKFVEGFQVVPLVAELIEVVLHQPYRGNMIR